MNRWLCFATAAALLLMGCDDKDGKKTSNARPPAVAGDRISRGSSAAPSAFADAPELAPQLASLSAADGGGGDVGRRFFDGAVLRGGGFAVPDDAVVSVPGPGAAARRPQLSPSGARSRTPSDLTVSAPPAPDAADLQGGAGASSAWARGAGRVLAAFDAFQRATFSDPAPVMSRAGWRAAPRKGEAVAMHPTHVTVHHTEGPQTMTAAATAAAVRGIQHYHMAGRAAEGKDVWEDIGYHFLIDGAGRVVEGRPAETLGAHAGGANQDNIGVAMMGNFDRQKPTAAQVQSLTRLVSFLAVKYRQDPARAGFLEPHRHYDNTDCPGKNMMAILAALRKSVNAETALIVARLTGAKKGQFVPVLVTNA